MYAMQYPIALPADYDMGVIRARVAAASSTLDDRAGLGFKTYLLRERGVACSPVNEYAPFYFWRDTEAMADFLLRGGGFQNILRSFGRVPVQNWLGVAVLPGPARGERAVVANRRVSPVPADLAAAREGAGLQDLIGREVEALRELASHPDIHTAALAVDPHGWQSVRFTLWRDGAAPADAAEATERYEVLHVSAPELELLGAAAPGVTAV